MRAALVVGLLIFAAIVVAVVALVRDSQAGAAPGENCPPGAARVDLTLPDTAAEVKLRVFNGTAAKGTAERVSRDFKDRGFQMQPAAATKSKHAGVAIVRYGPKTVGAAQWIRAYFLGEAETAYNPKQTTDVIDVVIGERFRQLATRTEVNQSLAQLSEPQLPPGACPAP
ncbi:LytR C-terminal domain-containing protein [Actinoplanes sp. NPDC024001]|uniref:LytR C-terminal domain-containing protein n=1 Tax=Actinoplanes sp. NPDC024001 TaxID=3154598 RepID=UPI0033CFDE4C